MRVKVVEVCSVGKREGIEELRRLIRESGQRIKVPSGIQHGRTEQLIGRMVRLSHSICTDRGLNCKRIVLGRLNKELIQQYAHHIIIDPIFFLFFSFVPLFLIMVDLLNPLYRCLGSGTASY